MAARVIRSIYTAAAGLVLFGLPHLSLAETIRIDGSSTVYPITEAVAEEFGLKNPEARVIVGVSGTGGGFKKFCAGEIEIADASRPIKQAEIEACTQAKIDYVELPVAYDALTVVVNPKNTWVKSLTVAELKKVWQPEAQENVKTWNQIRPEWPNAPIALFGPGVDSGTYDYFTEVIVGKQHSSRGDFTSSEDDNVLVQGVAGDVNALGFFGLAYYHENASKLRAVPIDDEQATNGAGPVEPTVETVLQGTYQPLARSLFIYVRKDAIARKEIEQFVSFYLKDAETLSTEVGYIPLPATVYALATERFTNRIAGTIFTGGKTNVTLESALRTDMTGRAKLAETTTTPR